MSFIGNCAYTCKLRSFATLEEAVWIKSMEQGFRRCSNRPLSDGQIRSWRDCFRVLQDCIRQLPPEFLKLNAVFEYALPFYAPGSRRAERGIAVRADVILVSSETVLVLEFKGRDWFIGDVNQARKYHRRIQKFHEQSVGMRKKAILALTAQEGICLQYPKVSVRSRELLAQEMVALFEPAPKPHPDFRRWLHSDFSVRESRKVR